MQPSLKVLAITLISMSIVIACFVKPSHCQSSRPSSNILFEPTLSFIRQNLLLINSYVALMRSIFVGAYDRPLITSTDSPATSIRNPPPVVPPMNFQSLMAAAARLH